MANQDIKYNIPKDADSYRGKFIVFFPQDAEPVVLFGSFLAEEAYKKAHEFQEQEKKEPLVIRVPEVGQDNMAELLTINSAI